MKKFIVLPLALLSFAAACSDAANSPLGFDGASEARGRTQGGGTPVSSQVTVAGTFQVVIPGSGGIRESGPGINEEGKEIGRCDVGGKWWNPSAQQFSRSIPHSHCIDAGGARTVSWSFGELATFVNNGNVINLNFNATDRTVHFNGNQDRTEGQNGFSVEQDGGTWTLDLNQFDIAGNAFGCATSRCLTADATFVYEGQSYTSESVVLSW